MSIGVKFLKHKNAEMLEIDLNGANPTEILEAIKQAKEIIRKQPLSSMLILTNVTNANFNTDVIEGMKEFTSGNKPYVKASAIVGLSGLHKVIYTMVTKFSGRSIPTFDNIEEAKNWLATKN